MLAFRYQFEERLRGFLDMSLCTKFSCYHCHGKTCIVREDALKKMEIAEHISNTGKEGRL